MSNIANQDVDDQVPENAPLEHEDLEKVTGGTPSSARDLAKLVEAKHDMMKALIANLRV